MFSNFINGQNCEQYTFWYQVFCYDELVDSSVYSHNFDLQLFSNNEFLVLIDDVLYNNLETNNNSVYYLTAPNFSDTLPHELIVFYPQFCSDTLIIDVECSIASIELLSFQAESKEGFNLITWQTASAIDEEYFVLQHSANGIDFNEIARVPVVNHSSGIESYSFEHISISAKNYYKLLTIDVSGVKRQVSNVFEVNQSSTQLINIYPTTTSDIINVFPPTTNVKVYNAYGQLMDAKNQNGQVDLSNFSSGIYFIMSDRNSFKVLKQ